MKKKVVTCGSFDMFHVGHLELLKRASEIGELHVLVSTDAFHLEKKGFPPVIDLRDRMEIVRNLDCVYQVGIEMDWHAKFNYCESIGAKHFVMGSDWIGKFDEKCKTIGVEAIYLPRTAGISTTLLRNRSSIEYQKLIIDIIDDLYKDGLPGKAEVWLKKLNGLTTRE